MIHLLSNHKATMIMFTVMGDNVMLTYCCIGLYPILLLCRCKVPMKVDALQGMGVMKVECGSQFSVALTKSGAVYTWYVNSTSLKFIVSVLV